MSGYTLKITSVELSMKNWRKTWIFALINFDHVQEYLAKLQVALHQLSFMQICFLHCLVTLCSLNHQIGLDLLAWSSDTLQCILKITEEEECNERKHEFKLLLKNFNNEKISILMASNLLLVSPSYKKSTICNHEET